MSRIVGHIAAATTFSLLAFAALSDPLPPDITYRPLPTLSLSEVIANDSAAKPAVMERQQALLQSRYDLSDNAIPSVMMSGGRKPVQGGVRVKLPGGVTWDRLARNDPDRYPRQGLLPAGFMPLPHVKQADRRAGLPERADRRDPIAGAARPAALRRRLRSSRPPDARIPAADLPHYASRARRRVARPAANHQELLRTDDRHHHAGADGRPAAAADAVPAGGVQPDRGPQSRGAEPGRHLPRLPLEFPHQRGLST